MLDQIYGWIQNIAVYLIVISAVMHVIPRKDYGKYIRFFSGMVLILLIFTPFLKLTGMEADFRSLYQSKEYEMERQEMERAAQIYEQAENLEGNSREQPENGAESGSEHESKEDAGAEIKVEEIEIGK